MRPAFIAFVLLAGMARATSAPAQGAPAAPPAVRIPGVSAAGNAVLAGMQGKVDPAAVAVAREDAAFRQQMQAVLAAPVIDVAKLAAAMQRGQAVTAKIRAINDAHLIAAVRALPPADRTPFLRAIIQQQQQAQRPPAR